MNLQMNAKGKPVSRDAKLCRGSYQSGSPHLLLAWGTLFGSSLQQPPTGITALSGIKGSHNLTDEAVCQDFLCNQPDGFRVALYLLSPQSASFWQHTAPGGEQLWARTEEATVLLHGALTRTQPQD